MAGGQAVARRDEGQRVQRRQLVLVADAHEHVALAEGGAQHVEQREAALEDAHQLVDLGEVLEAVLGQQPRRAADVEGVLGGVGQLGEGGRRRSRKPRSVAPATDR